VNTYLYGRIHPVHKYIIGCFFSAIYLAFSSYYALNVQIVGDTREYFWHFSKITEIWFPFGSEFFVSILMHITRILGGGFEFFIFLNYLLWLPLVYFLASRITRKPAYVLILIFLLTSYFFSNAAFLVRQYEALILFIYFVFFGFTRFGVVFLIFSIGAHLYSLALLAFSTSLIIKMIFSGIGRCILFLLMVVTWFSLFDLGGIFVGVLGVIPDIVGADVGRKIIGVQSEFDNTIYSVSPYIVFINYVLVISLLAIRVSESATRQQKIVFSICLISGVLFFLLSRYPILANRAGFVSYFLSVPALIYTVTSLWERKIRFM
jgi:hypothetical protein